MQGFLDIFDIYLLEAVINGILLSGALRQHAKLERDAMLVGQGHYFELWDSGRWDAKLAQALSGPSSAPPGMEDFSL